MATAGLLEEPQAGAGLEALDGELAPDVTGAGEAIDAAGGSGSQFPQGDDRVWSVLRGFGGQGRLPVQDKRSILPGRTVSGLTRRGDFSGERKEPARATS